MEIGDIVPAHGAPREPPRCTVCGSIDYTAGVCPWCKSKQSKEKITDGNDLEYTCHWIGEPG